MARRFDPDFDSKGVRQFQTRAAGQLYMGPLQAKGYDNRVLELTVNELEFQDSDDAARFIDAQRRKYGTRNELIKQRRLKLRSVSSDTN